jgi:hypothetical protein
MISTSSRPLIALAALLLAAGCGSSPKSAEAPEPPATGAAAEEPLPSVDEVLARFVEVTGGRAAHERIVSWQMRGTIEMPSVGVKGTVSAISAAPRRSHTVMELAGLGTHEMGTDGEVVWEISPMTGNRVLEGEERNVTLRDATFHADLNWSDVFSEAVVESRGEVDGAAAYVVKLTAPDGTWERRYYDVDSGLLVQREMTVTTQMGKVAMTELRSDYREAGGVRVPFRTVIRVMNIDQVFVVEEAQENVDLADDAFAIPAPIRSLMGAGEAI